MVPSTCVLGFALEHPSCQPPPPCGDRGGGSVLPSFLQREGCLIQAQARTVVKSRKKTSDSRIASRSIVPARTADKRDGTKGQGRGVSPRSQTASSLLWSHVPWAVDKGLRLVLGDSVLSGGPLEVQ